MNITSFFSDITCGEACWNAKDDVCKCSCGGANHGIKRRGGAPTERTAKIDGYMYRLVAVGARRDVYDVADKINKAQGFSYAHQGNPTYHGVWRETEKGAPARLKYATKPQIANWVELEPFRTKPGEWQTTEACLVWMRVEMPPKVTCQCGKCPLHWLGGVKPAETVTSSYELAETEIAGCATIFDAVERLNEKGFDALHGAQAIHLKFKVTANAAYDLLVK